jgi:hypothetical protein
MGRRKTNKTGSTVYTRKKNPDLASSDEEEYSIYEKRYQDHVNQQSRKLLEAGVVMMNPAVDYNQ